MNNILPNPNNTNQIFNENKSVIKYQYIPNDKNLINDVYETLFNRFLKKK